MENFVVISGCSGGGKSTLLDALAERGYPVVKEPGRRIVKEALASGGEALPWIDLVGFLRTAIRVSLADRDVSKVHPGWVFFDRGLIDAASGMEELTGKPFLNRLARRHRYHQNVFLTPPWPEIYVRDHERRHDLADGIEEYERLLKVYPALGYALHLLPKVSVMDRVDFVLDVLRTQAPPGPAS